MEELGQRLSFFPSLGMPGDRRGDRVLLDFLFHPLGSLPAAGPGSEGVRRIISILATRAGQQPKDWIRSQILAYLAYVRPAPAEEGSPAGRTGSAPALNPVESAGPAGADPFRDAGPASRGGSSPGACESETA